jgi:hypothetical protein
MKIDNGAKYCHQKYQSQLFHFTALFNLKKGCLISSFERLVIAGWG